MISKAESILLWSSNMWGLGMGMFGPLYAVFATQVGASVLDLSWVYALYLVFMGIGVIVVGKVADRVGHEVLLVYGYAISALGAFGYLLVESLSSLLFVQILMALAIALSMPTWYALYDKHSGDGSHDGFLWGLSSGLYFVCQGIALVVGGYVASTYSFDVLFILMGCTLTISTLYQARILRYRVQ